MLLILEQAGLVLLELCDEVVGLHDLLDVVVLQELNLLLLALSQLPDGHLILRLHHGVLVIQAVDLILQLLDLLLLLDQLHIAILQALHSTLSLRF